MFYLIDKHKGVTSFWAIHILRRILNIKKIGHTGTLDPLATGLLIVATGNSTKLIPQLEKCVKTYIFTLNMEGSSTTGDLEGEITFIDKEVLEAKRRAIDENLIKELLEKKFIGKIKQIPPRYSAIKIDGKKACDMARKGQEFEMKSRDIEVFNAKLIKYEFPEVTIEMTVSAGTYIRTMAEDIGKALGLNAYVTMLHRSKIGNIGLENAKHIESIKENDNISEVLLFPDMKKAEVTDEQHNKIQNGYQLANFTSHNEGDLILLTYNQKIFSLVKVKTGILEIIKNNL